MANASLVIPCYNEAANLPLLVARCREAFAGTQIETVLVDNGSTDDSARVLKNLVGGDAAFRVARVEKNQGYGFGILSGLDAASSEILGWTHADMQTDPADFVKALALFGAAPSKNATFVKGRRRGRPIADEIFTSGMTVFETLLLGEPLIDINAQPTVFHRDFYAGWKNPPHDFSLDLFAYFGAKKSGLEVRRFDVKFGERAHGVSHWNVNWAAKRKFIRRTIDYSLDLRRRLAGKGAE